MPAPFTTLAAAAAWYDAWLTEAALPLWASAGRDPARGSFQEALTLTGEPWPAARRARVQTRQVWVYATAAAEGLGAAYGEQAETAYGFYRAHYLRPDGVFARTANDDGVIVDPTALLYEQAFSLLAMAALEARAPGAGAADAEALRTALAPMRHAAGGFRETGAQPYQANAHMHLLEAALAWEETGAAGWAPLADEIAELALARFIDPESGAIREFFDADWRALPDAAGGLLEPGHQFEWAWLLNRWGTARGRPEVRATAARLYAAGQRGVDARGVAAGALWSDLGVREPTARLWAQTEHLKAALVFGGEAETLRAAQALALYLETPRRGTWRDKLHADGGFVDEPAPATSFYHLLGAILPLRRAVRGA
jgi:mannose-1-phosphate guanylyltransferase / mannose-6-phosphate isomerase